METQVYSPVKRQIGVPYYCCMEKICKSQLTCCS